MSEKDKLNIHIRNETKSRYCPRRLTQNTQVDKVA
jgi:hypothetical protein